MLLYGHHDSGHAYKVRLFLLMAGLSHRYEWVDITLPRSTRPDAFQHASVYGEVPVLVDEGRSWCQSNAILIHLAQKSQRFCGEPHEWPRVMEWLFWEPNRINFSVPNLRFAHRYVPQPPEVLFYLAARAQADLKTLKHWTHTFLSNRFCCHPASPSPTSVAPVTCSGQRKPVSL